MKLRSALHKFRVTACLVVFFGPTMNATGEDSSRYPIEPIPMHLEVEISDDIYYVGENFPITIRIVNPHAFDVFLGGFQFGPLEPHTEIGFPEGTVFPGEGHEFVDISLGGTISAMGGPPILVPARGRLEHRRLVYSGTKVDMGHWVLMPAGRYWIRMRSYVGAVVRGEPKGYAKVEWTSDVVEFMLKMPVGRERTALEFLRRQAEKLAEHQRNPRPGFRSIWFKLGMYRQFLERFSDTVYAPEIRWETAKLLYEELGNKRIPEDEVADMVDLFDECLTFCLEQGGAYAEEFIDWDMKIGGNRYLDFAVTHERWALVDQVLESLDRRHPENEAAKILRRARVTGHRESAGAARRMLETVIEKFPEHRCAEAARKQIENIDRGRWPPKAADDEQRLYEAAAKEVYRSPENGRRMLESVLEQFPNGRYRIQIRGLIDAIEDGSWPPKLPQAPHLNAP